MSSFLAIYGVDKSLKKIVFFHLLNDFSGSPRVLSQVIDTAKHHGYDVELFLGGGTDGFLSNIAVQVIRYRYKRFNNKFMTLVTYLMSQVDLFLRLLKYKDQDVIFYVNTILPFGAALAGRVLNKKIIYHIHETSIKPKLLKTFLRSIASLSSSQNIYVSKFLASCEDFVNVRKAIVYNALPTTFERIASDNLYSPLTGGFFEVLMICSLKDYKGVLEFIEIARILEESIHIRFTLVVGASPVEVDRYFASVNIPPNVILNPSTPDVLPYYSKTSILLSLSRPNECVETFGLTILEALAFGIPCIVPPVGGPVELIEDDKEGYLMSASFPEKIAEKLNFLARHPDECVRLSKQARLKAHQFSHFNFEREILKVLDAM